MKLNIAKCEYLGVNIKKNKKDVKIMLPDQTPMKRIDKTTYLGGNVYDNGSSKGEVENRISRAAIVFGKLRPFWSLDSSTKWKLRVYESMVASILFYGLESVVLTDALGQRMDYFQAKCLRNIMKIQAAFYSDISN